MSMDISKLGIVVESQGIKEASTALGGLSRSAGTADTKVTSLTAKLGLLNTASSQSATSANALTGVMGQIATALAATSANASATAKALLDMHKGMGDLTTTTNQATNALNRKSAAAGTVVTTIKAMATGFSIYGAINFTKTLVEQVDGWGMMQSKLKLATGSMEEAKRVQIDLFNTAQNLRAPLEDMGKLYTRLAPAMTRMGKSAFDTKTMVEGVTLALKLGGAGASEASSTMLQFSQAANAGRLNGAEFNSVAENGVLILRALEDHLGKNQAELKKMGAAGTLTFDLISEALKKAVPKWRKEFEELPLTFEGAMTRMKNAWFKAVGEIGGKSQIGVELAKSIKTLEDMIPKFVEVLIGAFNLLMNHGDKLLILLGAIAGVKLAQWAIAGAAAFVKLCDAIALVGVASKFLGGPLVWIAGLLAAGATAWMLWSDKGKQANDDLTKATFETTAQRIATVQKEIDKLRERNELAAGGKKPPEPVADTRTDEQKAQVDQIKRLQKELEKTDLPPLVRSIHEANLKNLNAAYVLSLQIVDGQASVLKHEKDISDQRDKAKKDAETTLGYTKQMGTATEKMNIALQEARDAYGGSIPPQVEAMIRESFLKKEAKAETEAAKAIKAANEERINAAKSYEALKLSFAAMKESGRSDDKASAAEIALRDITERMKTVTNKEQLVHMEATRLSLVNTVQMEQERDGYKAMLKAREDGIALTDGLIVSAEKELVTLNQKIAAYTLGAEVMEDYGLATAKAKLAAMETMSQDGNDPEIERLRRLVKLLEEVKEKKAQVAGITATEKLQKALDKLKPADFGMDFERAFGKVGKSIDLAGKALDKYGRKMKDVEDIREKAAAAGVDPKEAAEAAIKASKAEAAAEMEKYGDMAGAAKGFFDEKTAAHKALAAIEQGIAMKRMMMTMQEAGVSISASLEKAGASTLAGAAKAFEQMGVYGFIGAAAIMSFMASKGVGSGGGGGSFKPISAEDRQDKQGTGTVLGDDTAKSESIAKSLDRLRDNSNVGLTVSTDMLQSLRAIERGMNGLTNSIAGTLGMTTGKNFGIQTGESTGGGVFGTGFLGSKRKTEIMDAGLSINGRLGNIGVQNYVDVQNTKKNWYGKTSTSNSRQMQEASGEVEKYFNDIFSNISKSIITAGTSLGQSATDMQAKLNAVSISAELSFKDLKGEELQEAISAVVGRAADEMAAAAMPGIAMFQNAGEGLYETLIRVAAGQEEAKNALDGLGIAMVNIYAVQDATGDVGAELVKQSIVIKEAGSEVGKIVNLLEGDVHELVDAYKSLKQLSNDLKMLNLGDVSLDLIRGAGGIEELSSAFDDFFDNILEPAEQASLMQARLAAEFGALGRSVPKTKAEFRDLVAELQRGDAASQALAGRVLGLSGAWADAQDAADELLESQKDAAEAAQDLIDEQNDKIESAKDALRAAYDKEASALQNVKDKMQGFSDSLAHFRDSLMMGDKSPLNALDKYALAKQKFDEISERAKAGDETAIAELQKVSEEFLAASRVINASGAQYTEDFKRVLEVTDAVKDFTDAQVDQATQQLSLLEKQVSGLIEIKDSVLTVAQAIEALTAITAQAAGLPIPAKSATPTGAVTPPPAGAYDQAVIVNKQNEELRVQLMAMTAEIAALRIEQQRQHEQLVAAQFAAAEAAAALKAKLDAEAAANAAYGNNWNTGDAGS